MLKKLIKWLNDADKFKEEDELIKKRIEAKNGLESYLYNLKATLDDEKLKDKIEDEDRETLTTKIERVWNG